MGDLKIYSDGGARGNPGPAASAFVVYEHEEIIYEEGKYLGIKTNNFAEYIAVLMAMKWLDEKNFKDQEIIFYLDSELVVRQLTGVYKIKNKVLLELVIQIKALQKKLNLQILFKNVRRSENKKADALVNQTLDSSRL